MVLLERRRILPGTNPGCTKVDPTNGSCLKFDPAGSVVLSDRLLTALMYVHSGQTYIQIRNSKVVGR
jgi:hypothetical protein